VRATQQPFSNAMMTRQQAFGGDINRWPSVTAQNVISLCFAGELDAGQRSPTYGLGFEVPDGLDLTAEVALGKAVVLAWLPNALPAGSIRDFRPARETQNTMLRLTVPVQSSPE